MNAPLTMVDVQSTRNVPMWLEKLEYVLVILVTLVMESIA